MRSALEREDTLSIMATGYGKLVIYQIAAIVLRGPTVVLSPLIAVPCDQVDAITAQPVRGALLIGELGRCPSDRAPRGVCRRLDAGRLGRGGVAGAHGAFPGLLTCVLNGDR